MRVTESVIRYTDATVCMSVELPFAPVDGIIRRNAGELRVSADAAEELARRIQSHGAELAIDAAARHADRRTVQAEDIETYFALFE